MTLFKNKYRIESIRLQNWDYGWNGKYFITIVTLWRKCYFGKIVNDEMELSEIGIIAQKCWLEIPIHFPFVNLDKFVVMPNHVHGIIIIDKKNNGKRNIDGNDDNDGNVETQNFASPPKSQSNQQKNHFGPQSQNLASVVRGYKIGVMKSVNNVNFGWQPRFHDHIIRNETEYNRIQNYIINNPAFWNNDKFKL